MIDNHFNLSSSSSSSSYGTHPATGELRVVALGAGQDVGRSCLVATVGGKNVMLDCGMHMGYRDERRFPDFGYLSSRVRANGGSFDGVIDAVLISHFHLDHCGALPYFTEMLGFSGPVLMSYPTKAICPILLDDYRRIMVDRKGETNFFTAQMIRRCMQKVVPVAVGETVAVDDSLRVTAYYAGHVLGAVMFHVSAGGQSLVYTGDYNMTPDRHLGAARIDRVMPDLLITETTYATTIRDSKRIRERDFLKRVHRCVDRGGKVLIPVFALGRAQELCILIETYWERMNLGHIPVYFSAGLTEKANLYYKLFITWTSEKIKSTFIERNLFDFRFIKPFERSFADLPGPMVLFATPGMLHAGTSLDVFKKWAPDPLNLVVIPGFCVVGTVGNRLLAGREHKGKTQRVMVDQQTTIDVNCKIKYLSFSAHADAKGIKQLIRQVAPKHVMLVHGEKEKMEYLSAEIVNEFAVPCYFPPNGVSISVPTTSWVPAELSFDFLRANCAQPSQIPSVDHPAVQRCGLPTLSDDCSGVQPSLSALSSHPIEEEPAAGEANVSSVLHGIVLLDSERKIQVISQEEASDTHGIPIHEMQRSVVFPLPTAYNASPAEMVVQLSNCLHTQTPDPLSLHGRTLSCDKTRIWSNNAVLEIQSDRIVFTWEHSDQSFASSIIAALTQLCQVIPRTNLKRELPPDQTKKKSKVSRHH